MKIPSSEYETSRVTKNYPVAPCGITYSVAPCGAIWLEFSALMKDLMIQQILLC